MKKIIQKTAAMLAVILFLTGCSTSDSMIQYTMPVKNSTAPVTLTLNEKKQTFQLSMPQTKSLPYGSYTIKDDVMTCTSYDDKMVFHFRIVDDNTMEFIEKDSTPSIVDGGTFTRSTNVKTDSE